MPDWSELPLLSSQSAQRSDDAGNILGASPIDAASLNIDPRISDFILYGVFNGAFARGPELGVGSYIGDDNPLPDWTGPIQVSGGAITASWVADSASPSGYNLRFTIAAGAAGDEAYFEEIVPIGGSRRGWLASAVRAGGIATTSAAGFSFKETHQYLDATGVAVGSAGTSSTALASGGPTLYLSFSGPVAVPPNNAALLRIRVGVYRNTAAVTDTATVDVADVRVDRGMAQLSLTDQSAPDTHASSVVAQIDGSLHATPGGTTGRVIVNLPDNERSLQINTGHLRMAELTAPGTPASGYYAIYPKTDGILYGKDDAGNETVLGGGSGKVTVYTSGAGNSWTPLPGSRSARVLLLGAGGGGASGAEGTNAAVRTGGTGGGGGSFVERSFRISDLTTPVTVAIGTGGTGGAPTGGAGADGAAGGNTTFGTYLTAYGGGAGLGALVAPTGASGGGGAGTAGVGQLGQSGTSSIGGLPAQTTGALGLSGQGAGSAGASPGHAAEFGGGAGGGHNNGVTAQPGGTSIWGGGGGGSGGNGGSSQSAGEAGGNTGVWDDTAGGGGGAGGAVRANGTAGASGAGIRGGKGGGGGGGSTAAATSAGDGGAGGLYGGGGGGGGGTVSGGAGTAGAGGDGGNGAAIIIEW